MKLRLKALQAAKDQKKYLEDTHSQPIEDQLPIIITIPAKQKSSSRSDKKKS